MRAARLHGIEDIRVEDVPAPPPPGPGQVAIAVEAAGICGSDLHNYRTGQWFAHLPVTPGHEFAGRVAAVGPGVAGLREGDRVVADSRVSCGVCQACRDGRPNACAAIGFVGEVCDGGFAPLAVLPASAVLKVEGALAPEIAALSEPLGVALHTLARLGPERDRPILIAGAGPIGGLCAIAAAGQGYGPLFVVDRNGERRDLVCRLSGATPLALEAEAVAEAIPGGPALAIEATGSGAVVEALAGVMAAGGRMALVGLFHGTQAVDLNRVVERELTLTGASVYTDEQARALDLLPDLADRLAPALSTGHGIEAVPDLYAELIGGRAGYLKAVLSP
ncbi:MAG: alcohol dehydrogenase catalytic domain-containing protein [Azospirillaceae bacterium]